MAPLSSRQRLLRLFAGQDLDRIPIWLLAPYHQVPYYADIYHIDAYKSVVDAIERCCDTFDRRRPDMGFCYNANPDLRFVPIDQPGKSGRMVGYRDRGFEQYTAIEGGVKRVKHFVTDPSELQMILDIPYVAPAAQLDSLRLEKQELGERGLLMMDLGDPLEPLYHLCSAEDFSIWTLTDYDKLLSFIDAMHARVIALYKQHLESGIPDAYFIVGAEFAGPPLVSPDRFGDLCRRYVKTLVDLIRGYGKIAIVHYHGQLARILPEFAAINPDGLHTIEAPPTGDCSLSLAREKLGKAMTLIGNIQYDDLCSRSPGQIKDMVKAAIDEAKSGRFILSPTAGPYDPFPSPTLIENYLAFIEAGMEYGICN